MPVDAGLALRDGLGEADGVDDRGVVELVTDDDVILAEERGGHRLVRVPAADEAQARRGADQPGAGGLEIPVNVESAADEADRGGAGAVAIEGRLAGGHHLRLGAEAEIVVRGEHDHLSAAFHPDPGSRRALEVIQLLVDAVAAKLVEFAAQALLERSAHRATSRITFPA